MRCLHYANIQLPNSNLRLRFNILKPLTFERIVRRDSLLRIQREHFVEKIQSRVGHVGKFFPESSSVLFFRLQRVEVGQLDDIRPDSWRRRPAEPRYDVELKRLRASLEECLFREQFTKDASDTPDVDGRTVAKIALEDYSLGCQECSFNLPFFPEQQFWWSEPQCYDFVCVRTFTVFCVTCQPEIGKFYFAPKMKNQ